MDRKEEQQIEIESLLSIYPEELTVLTRENTDPELFAGTADVSDERLQFTLKITSSEAAVGDSVDEVISTLWRFVFPEDYPDVPPEIFIVESGELLTDSVNELLRIAQETAAENVGMASIFSIVSTVQDYLNKHAEECLLLIKEVSERSKREEEEIERKKMEGTRVSVESFIAWKIKFDAERAKKTKTVIDTSTTKRLTGRQMFEENVNLDSSDQQLMEEGEECANVDERETVDAEEFDRDLFEQELLNEEGDGSN